MSSLPEQAVAGQARPYAYADVRAGQPVEAPATQPSGFTISATSAVPPVLLDQARAEAAAAGYAVGWAQGLREATEAMADEVAAATARTTSFEARRAAELSSALATIAQAARSLETRAIPVAAELETAILAAAVEIAEALLGRALRDSVTADDVVRRALVLAPNAEPVQVRLSPADFAALAGADSDDQSSAGEIVRTMSGARAADPDRTVTLRCDPSLRRGDAVAVSATTTVDARLDVALARVREVLGR
jgi:flagellar assembly protein FliH